MEVSNVGKAFTWALMGSEAIQAIQDLRWMLLLCVLLIAADYRFGRAESKKRHLAAVAAGDNALAKMTEFHFSRAVRRTCNKFIDYITLLLVFCVIGFAITEPYGICDHTITSGVAVIIACICELCSIFGHFFYLRGIKLPEITWKNAFVFIGRFLAGFARTKDPDLGEAIDETIEKTISKNGNDERQTD